MAGQYAKSFNFLLIKNVTVALGDFTLQGGGIAFQLEPQTLPNTAMIELQLFWRSRNFTSDITIKGIQAATPNVTVGTEVFSQTVSGSQWNDTGTFQINTPVAREWITLVSNNANLVGGAAVDESFLQVEGVAANGMLSSFFNTW